MEATSIFFKDWRELNMTKDSLAISLFEFAYIGSLTNQEFSSTDFQNIQTLFQSFYFPYCGEPKLSITNPINGGYFDLPLHEGLIESQLIEKLDFFIYENFRNIFKDIKDVDFESKNKWIKDIGPKFQYSYLRKLCVVIYTLSGIIFSPEYKGLGGFLNMLKTSRLSNNPGLFYYICSRFSILTHPYNINACDLFQLQSKFPQEIIQNLKSQIIILDLTIFDEINTKFVDLLTEFLTCPLNIPYFTLITTIKYKLSSNPLHEDYYSEAEVEDIQNLSEEQKKTCKDLLKKIISRLIIENRIFLISKLEGNVVGETMQEGIFFLKDFLLPDLEVYRPEELNKILKNTVSQAIKAFFMVILGHEIAHETRFEIAPKKSILFTTPKKDIFSTNDPKKPFEIGAGWEIYLAKKRIHLSDFLKNDDLVKLFLIPKFWEKKTMEDVFEKHFDNKLHMAQTPKGTNWQEEEDEPGYRCCICSYLMTKRSLEREKLDQINKK